MNNVYKLEDQPIQIKTNRSFFTRWVICFSYTFTLMTMGYAFLISFVDKKENNMVHIHLLIILIVSILLSLIYTVL